MAALATWPSALRAERVDCFSERDVCHWQASVFYSEIPAWFAESVARTDPAARADLAASLGVLADEVDLETFFNEAPAYNPDAALITGVICGVRVEEIEDPLMQQLRWLDKLIDDWTVSVPSPVASVTTSPALSTT